MGNVIDRFSFRFRFYIYRGIRLLLADCQGVPATILLCCTIDLLAKYRSGMPDGNKAEWRNLKGLYYIYRRRTICCLAFKNI